MGYTLLLLVVVCCVAGWIKGTVGDDELPLEDGIRHGAFGHSVSSEEQEEYTHLRQLAGKYHRHGDVLKLKRQYVSQKPEAIKKWPNNLIYYRLSTHYSSEERRKIEDGLARLSQQTCLRFEESQNAQDYVRVYDGGACYSFVGMHGGEQGLSLGQLCLDRDTVMHEFLHAAGFHHEQCRPDRSMYIEVFYKNVHPSSRYNYQIEDTLKQQRPPMPYDYHSIMHYPDTAWVIHDGLKTMKALDPNVVLEPNGDLTDLDIDKVNRAYVCDGGQTGRTTARTTYRTTASTTYSTTSRTTHHTTRPTRTTSTTVSPNGCEDVREDCAYHVLYCEYTDKIYVDYMRKYCAKTCNLC